MATTPKSLSAFGLAALSLDEDLQGFDRLVREIDKLSINSDKGLDRAQVLLTQFDECRQRIGTGMHQLAATLDAARQRMEDSTKIVAERAAVIHDRQRLAGEMLERFRVLGDMVKQVNTAVGQLRQPGSSASMSKEDQAFLASRIPEFNSKLGVLVDEARKLMEDAHAANMKALERNADSLRQSLQTASHRLHVFVERHTTSGASTH